jgi:curved DNA-binding protein CbpA
MTGKLKLHPLAELLREIVAEGLSGSLRLEHERIKTAIYFEGGKLVYATSNLRPHRLSESLRRWQVITEAQFAALAGAGRNDAETGKAVVEQKVLTKEALGELRTRLMGDVLRPALLWTEGSWDFDARVRLLSDVRSSIELPELLMEAARRLPSNLASSRFPDPTERLRPAGSDAGNMNLLPVEAFVLSRIDAPLTLRELLAVSGLGQEETLHACYVLALGGAIERDGWPRAFTPEQLEKALAAGAAAAQSVPASQPVEAKKVVEEPRPVEPEVDERKELEELFERMERATTYYQVLGVTRSADQETLKQTYHSLARRFHPDRFHQDTELRRRVEDVFARIAQAYETLRDKRTRATYDLKIGRESLSSAPPETSSQSRTAQPSTPSSSNMSPAQRAEEQYQRGQEALRAGKAAQALNSFAEAARLEPGVARYRAQYGQALAASAQMRHRAETEIQAAIMLEPSNVIYRIMLARLYQKLGFIKRAQGELDRVRSIDPENAEAIAMLAQLQSTQGAR